MDKKTRVEVERLQPTFKSLPIQAANDKRLSFKASGLLYYFFTKPDDWKGHLYDLEQNTIRDTKTGIRSAMRELEEYGYAELKKDKNEKNQFAGSYYKIYLFSKKPVNF